jgi:hypothetical protein
VQGFAVAITIVGQPVRGYGHHFPLSATLKEQGYSRPATGARIPLLVRYD